MSERRINLGLPPTDEVVLEDGAAERRLTLDPQRVDPSAVGLASFTEAPEPPAPFENEDGSVTVPLAFPVTYRTRVQGQPEQVHELHELTLKRPKARHLRQLAGIQDDVVASLKLIEAISGQPAPVIDELDGADLERITEATDRFFGRSRPTGRSGSGSSRGPSGSAPRS